MGANNKQERRENGINNLFMQGQTDFANIIEVESLNCTSVGNTEHMGLSMEVYTFTHLLSMLLMTIPEPHRC